MSEVPLLMIGLELVQEHGWPALRNDLLESRVRAKAAQYGLPPAPWQHWPGADALTAADARSLIILVDGERAAEQALAASHPDQPGVAVPGGGAIRDPSLRGWAAGQLQDLRP